MNCFARFSISLRGLILLFVLLAVTATLCNSLIVAYAVQRDALIHSALQANRAYAFKVASSINEFLRSAHSRLDYSSKILGSHFTDPQVLEAEAMRLQGQDTELNSVLIIDANGKALQAYPEMPQIVGVTLTSNEIQQALKAQRPMVSHGYLSAAGNLIVFISNPVFSPSGQFLGIIGASIYIQQQGALHTLIASHAHLDGTSAFVTDQNRRLLYLSDLERIGETLTNSPTVDAALHGERGAMEAVGHQGVAMLSGYAQVADANWAVVAQQPRELALVPLDKLMRETLLKSIPAGLIGLVLILLGTTLITRPLQQLAAIAKNPAAPETVEQLRAVNAWYVEAAAIRGALLSGVQLLQQKLGRLRRAAQTDALTGLANRRAMDETLGALDQSGQQYAALALDVDDFKRVNDNFGHHAGDLALKQVATVIRQCCRSEDLACRIGGEEFVLLLPQTSLEVAGDVAERIRKTIASTEIDQIGRLTVSIGVAGRSEDTPTAQSILKCADELLYQAKEGGRNRVMAQGRERNAQA